MEKEETGRKECIACQRVLDLGVDAILVERGVVGPRGFVLLGDPRFFCDEDCLKRHINDEPVEQRRRRIP